MICPYCEQEVTPINHNNRGLRCPNCWERVAIEEVSQPEIIQPEADKQSKPVKSTRRRKQQ